MKKYTLICLLLAALLLCSCKKQDAALLQNAAPENSGMAFWYYDGETSTRVFLYDSAKEQEIIQKINALPTKEVSVDRISEWQLPCYGIEISDREGYDILLTYSNGLWLTKDGKLYEADFDLEALFNSPDNRDSDSFAGGLFMPNAGILAKYDVRFLTKSEDMTDERDGVSLRVVSYEAPMVTVELTNSSEIDFCYGTYFSLQKQIDGAWYTLPTVLSNYGFTDIAILLLAGESTRETCDLTMYGTLEQGSYRIVKEGMAAEFAVE